MKKAALKLIPALCMLLISAMMLGTTTYAWFSMNTTVTATGMNVTAKSDNKFLQIVQHGDTFVDSSAQNTVTAAVVSAALKPTTTATAISSASITAITSAADASDILWAETFSNSPDSSAKGADKIYTAVTAAASAGTDYTLLNSFDIRLNPTGDVTSASLKVNNVTIAHDAGNNDAMLAAVRVLVVCGDEWSLWSYSGVLMATASGNVLGSVTDTPVTVHVYIFFDGEDSATTTNNAADLGTDGYDVEVVFGV
ncbi:MAG: hypothetical protein J5854_03215 [Clostridia bacterium]|nr:hypothetical protein [Clostridia bacterium]